MTARHPPGCLFVSAQFAECVHLLRDGRIGVCDVSCRKIATSETDTSDVPSRAHSNSVQFGALLAVFVLEHHVVVLAIPDFPTRI